MGWKPTGEPTVRKQRDKWVVRVDGLDTETGNVRPRRIIRNAPAGKETSGFGNPYSVAYDTKRREILVPN